MLFRSRARRAAARAPAKASATTASSESQALLDQLDEIQAAGGRGVLRFADGGRLDVTNLGKVFWPELALTKGDLFRHYVRVAPALLPALADRPVVMKRFPNGITGSPFYQHRATETPAGVRVEPVDAGEEARPHVIGGDLLTLLYTVQLASISQDPSKPTPPHGPYSMRFGHASSRGSTVMPGQIGRAHV